MEYPKGYFEPQEYVTSTLDDMGHTLHFEIGLNTREGNGNIPQVHITPYQHNLSGASYWIDLDKIDEVITALAWAKHRMEEETRGKDSSG